MSVRGCGSRVAGGIYFECRLSPYGLPLEHFLYCPPIPLKPEWGLTPVSSRLIDDCIIDWIGQSHYPNVCDYVEEVRRFGLSGRLPRNFPFHLIGKDTRFCPVHGRAIIENWADLCNLMPKGREAACPHREHGASDGYCSGYWWEDVVNGEVLVQSWRWSRPVKRTMPAFSYLANGAIADFAPSYASGVIASFPLSRIVVVAGDGADDTWERLAQYDFPVALVEE